jgi:hypothetical protein
MNEGTSKIKGIIDDYKENLKNLKKIQGETMVFNSEWNKVNDNIKVIYCGDNPGKNEKSAGKDKPIKGKNTIIEGEYFVGTAGNALNSFISVNNKIHGIESFEAIKFNKTPFYSNNTKAITEVTDKNDSIYISIKLTVDCLYEIWKLNNEIKIFIFGFSIKDSYIVTSFKEVIQDEKYKHFLESLTILNHPSHNSLQAEIGKYLLEKFKGSKELGQVEIVYDELIKGIKKDWSKTCTDK